MKHLLNPLITPAILFMLSPPVLAAPLFDTFGPLDDATWGGDGIPNQEVAISSQFSNGESVITIAMSATERYSNPVVTNDGAGTYFATTGSNYGPNGESGYEGALWNFNFFIDIDSETETLQDYEITLFYDFDPTHDNGPTTLGTVSINEWMGEGPTSRFQGSENLMFDYLADTFLGFNVAPGGSFDPNAVGEYNFGIQVAQTGWSVENVRMDVQVSSVPVPAAAWLFGSALVGLISIGRNRKTF